MATVKRELLIIETATLRVVERRDVTGLDRDQIADAADKLRAKINDDEFYVEDTGEMPAAGEE